jgi:hypothetical protein
MDGNRVDVADAIVPDPIRPHTDFRAVFIEIEWGFSLLAGRTAACR